LFVKLRPDILKKARPCPGSSYVSFVERVMATINLGLYGCAFARARCDDSAMEAKLAKANSFKEVRLQAATEPRIKAAVAAVMKPGIDVMNERFGRLTWFEKPISVIQAEDEDVVLHFMDDLKTFFPDLHLAQPKSKQLATKIFGTWYSKHVVQTTYYVTISKCGGKEDCATREICADVTSANLEKARSFFRNPKAGPDKKFLSREDTPQDYPVKLPSVLFADENRSEGLKIDRERGAGVFVGNRVRSIASCSECGKPRCLFAQHALTAPENNMIDCIKDQFDYACGSFFFPDLDEDLDETAETKLFRELSKSLFPRFSLTCQDPVEKYQYLL